MWALSCHVPFVKAIEALNVMDCMFMLFTVTLFMTFVCSPCVAEMEVIVPDHPLATDAVPVISQFPVPALYVAEVIVTTGEPSSA